MSTVARQSGKVIRYVWSHPANANARIRAVLRAVTFQVRARLNLGVVHARVGERLILEAPSHAAGASKALYANPPDWAEMHAWRRILEVGDLFVDVGSNVGLYSVWAADCGAVPIAIEPDPINASRTRDNLELNHCPAEVHECALGASRGSMHFTVDGDTVNHLIDVPTSDRVRLVEVRTLDEVLAGRHVRGMKVDVEGAERLVLEGGQETLRQQRIDVLQLEWNSLSLDVLGESRDPVQAILASHGYVLCEPDEARNFALIPIDVGSARDADVFAVSPDTAKNMGF